MSSSSTSDDYVISESKPYLLHTDDNSPINWLATETPITNWGYQEEEVVPDDDDEDLLDGIGGLNITCKSSLADSNWLCYTAQEHENKPESDR